MPHKEQKYTRQSILHLNERPAAFPKFGPGDTIRVALKIKEGDKERLQYFEGDVIAIKNNGVASTFTIRKIAANAVSVERIIPFHSPAIDNIEFIRHGITRRAKMYYMRDRIGKAARVQERVLTSKQKSAE